MSPTSRTIALTGASGFVGRYIAAELRRRGHKVRALVRDRAKSRKHLPAGPDLTLIQGDILDGKSAAEACAGADACIHLIGIIREAAGGQTFVRMHIDATRAILKACADAKITRYIHMSALAAGPEGPSKYQKTKFEAERLVRRSGLDWTIFRPGLIHGEGGEFSATAAKIVRGQMGAPFMPYFVRQTPDTRVPFGPMISQDPLAAPIAVQDVAAAFVSALDKPETIHEIYNLVGPETFTWPEMLRVLQREIPGANDGLDSHGVPAIIAARAAKAASLIGLGGFLPFDEGMALMGGQDAAAYTEKARQHLGLSLTPFREALRTYARSL